MSMMEVRGRELVICDCRDLEHDDPDVIYRIFELTQRAVVWRFALPLNADDQAIAASLKHDLLYVTIPR